MSTAEKYDLAVVGGGPGGYVAAIKASQLGLKTVCIESRGRLGGTCLNVGCIPSKALLHSSHLYEEAVHEFSKHGIKINGSVEVDVPAMLEAKNKSVEGLTGGIEFLFKKYKVDYVKGFGKLTGPNSINVDLVDGGGSQGVEATNIMMASGSEVTPLPTCPVDNAGGRIVDSTGALDIAEVPRRLAVIGGGVIGLEMGSVWNRLGSEVTCIEFLDKIVPSSDGEVSKKFQSILKKQKMKFKMGTKVNGAQVVGDVVKLQVESKKGKAEELEFDVVLVAIGRRPFTRGMGLEELGVQFDRLNRIEVNEHFQTSVPSVYAIGDAIDGPMLAHKAEEEGIACVEHLAGLAGHVNYDCIPGVIYTHPEVANVGKTEEQLKEAGTAYKVGSFPFSANSRARATGGGEGFVKILVCAETDRILGGHIIGPNAGEMIAEVVLAMEYGASSEDVARTCHAHPTLSEALKEACMAAHGSPIHF
ncbi:unnamed protein product [Heterosigma akashiwo]